MTVETRTKLLVAVLAAAILLAGCATLVASDGGEEPEPEKKSPDARAGDTGASETAVDAAETTGQPATVDASTVAAAMASVETVSFEVNQSTALAGQSQSVMLTGAVDVDRGEARLATTVDSPFGTQSWTSYVVDGTVYSQVGETWTRANVAGAWNDTLAGGAVAGDAPAGDALTLDVVGTTTFDGNEVYVVEPAVNESALAAARPAFVENLTTGFDDSQTLDGLFEDIESEFDGGTFDWNHSSEWESENYAFDWNLSEEWESEDYAFDWNLSEEWESEDYAFDWNLSEEWESESDTFEWNLSEEWESESGTFEWNVSEEWESEGDIFDWNLSEEWEFDDDTFDWNLSEEWAFGEGDFGDGESDFEGGLVGTGSLGEFSGVNTTLYIDTETSRIRYAETTVSMGAGGEVGTVLTSTTFENFGGPVEIDLPAAAENAVTLWPRS
jgi:hypothetical protein